MDKWTKLKEKVEQRLNRFPTDITLIWVLSEMEFFESEDPTPPEEKRTHEPTPY